MPITLTVVETWIQEGSKGPRVLLLGVCGVLRGSAPLPVTLCLPGWWLNLRFTMRMWCSSGPRPPQQCSGPLGLHLPVCRPWGHTPLTPPHCVSNPGPVILLVAACLRFSRGLEQCLAIATFVGTSRMTEQDCARRGWRCDLWTGSKAEDTQVPTGVWPHPQRFRSSLG